MKARSEDIVCSDSNKDTRVRGDAYAYASAAPADAGLQSIADPARRPQQTLCTRNELPWLATRTRFFLSRSSRLTLC